MPVPAPSPSSSVTSIPGDIDAVVLTHAHPDHWTDFESFATWAGYGPRPRAVHRVSRGPPAHRCTPRRACGSGPTTAPRAWIDWRELAPNPTTSRSASCELRIEATDHGIATRAVCLAHDDATLAYSADSGPGWSVEELGRGIGTFLCEATYTQECEGSMLHLSGRQAGAMARAAGVGRLILTHRWPTVAADDVRREAELAFGRPVEQASMGAVFGW